MIGATEHSEQTAVIQWARFQQNVHPALKWLHAIPNGASLSSRGEARKLLEEGLTPGISDLFLPWAAKGHHGFYIEMKRPGNIDGVRDGQKDFLAYLEEAGFLGQVFDDAEEAISAICWYLDLPGQF
jgi:hypothetical protein